MVVSIWENRFTKIGVLLLGLTKEMFPFVLHLGLFLLYGLGVQEGKIDLVGVFLFQSFFECLSINFFQDGFQSIE